MSNFTTTGTHQKHQQFCAVACSLAQSNVKILHGAQNYRKEMSLTVWSNYKRETRCRGSQHVRIECASKDVSVLTFKLIQYSSA
jgi:hypothetical protein